MARNEDGEFELILGNKQLLSVFFLMVLLLGLCFVGGYVLGRSAAPVLNAANEPPPETKPLVVSSAGTKDEPPPPVAPPAAVEPTPAASTPPPPPIRTAPQVTESSPEPAKQTKAPVETAKATPPPKPPPAKPTPPATPVATAPAKPAPASSQPVPGRVYLQLSATDKDKAEVMVDLLRRKNLPGIAASIPDRPGLYRVLVGPLADPALAGMKAQLKANGFPADAAIRRVF